MRPGRFVVLWAVVVLAVAGCSGDDAVEAGPSPLPAPAAPAAPTEPTARAATVVQVTVAASTAAADRRARRQAAARYEAAHPGIGIAFVDSRDLDGERERFAAQLLTAMTDEVDVYEVDADWAPRFAAHAVDLRGVVSEEDLAGVAPATVEALTVGGGLVAVPLDGGRALLVSRYSPTPRHAADVAIGLAGLEPAPTDEDGPP